jgi:hypothetical protein
MSQKAFVLFFVILAVVMAVLGSVLPPANIGKFILIVNFFETMIPVLAVGALLKYLCGDQLS